MYKLVLENLLVLAVLSVVLGFAKIIAYSGLSLVGSLAVLFAVCYGANYLFARIFSALRNAESAAITALVLFFILSPAVDKYGYEVLIVSGILAMLSKYVLVMHMKHVFNPAAVSALILGLFGIGSAIWWIGTGPLILPAFVAGLLILRKLDKINMFLVFVFTSVTTALVFSLWHGSSVLETIKELALSAPLIFFGTIMLTEPLSTPTTSKQQLIYGGLVGLLYSSQFSIGPIFSSPELALIVGNIYAFAVSSKYYSRLILRDKKEIASFVYEFVFSSPKKLNNIPGQYLEWTMPHANTDNRGNRRYFTVASSPTEGDIKIGIRISPEKGSSFKKALLDMGVGDAIISSGLSGEFIMPEDKNKKLVFIAGGIGVTPFRSMIKYMLDSGDKRDVIFFYSNKTEGDIAYKDIFDLAGKDLGMKTIYAITDPGEALSRPDFIRGFIDENMIKAKVPDYKERRFYISGPRGMVVLFESVLAKMGVDSENIKMDYFPGF